MNPLIKLVKNSMENDIPLKTLDETNAMIRTIAPSGCEVYWPFEVQDHEQAIGVQQRVQYIIETMTHQEMD